MDPVAVIPARYGSKRLPGKPLLDLCGKPIIQHVYERAQEAGLFSRILVATDSEIIQQRVEAFGGEAVMTSPDHVCGTERIAEAVKKIDAERIINIQGDEPFLPPQMLRELWNSFKEEDVAVMGTIRHPLSRFEDVWNPHVVKVVTDENGFALYFSRSPIPHATDEPRTGKIDDPKGVWYKHIGVYAYRRDFLLQYPAFPRSPLEEVERLEQLRVLEQGFRIRVVTTSWETLGIDTEEVLKEARNQWKAREKAVF